jgi:hypothetical protein
MLLRVVPKTPHPIELGRLHFYPQPPRQVLRLTADNDREHPTNKAAWRASRGVWVDDAVVLRVLDPRLALRLTEPQKGVRPPVGWLDARQIVLSPALGTSNGRHSAFVYRVGLADWPLSCGPETEPPVAMMVPHPPDQPYGDRLGVVLTARHRRPGLTVCEDNAVEVKRIAALSDPLRSSSFRLHCVPT